MTAAELIDILRECDPNALVVAHLAFQGIEEITSVERLSLGGVGYRMSFDEVPVVRLSNGNPPHMRSQGMDVLPLEKP